MKVIYSFFSAIILLSACNSTPNKQSKNENSRDTTISEVKIDSLLQGETVLTLTQEILSLLKAKDYNTLAKYIHPGLGLRLSPYAYIDTANGIVFAQTAFLQKIKETTKLNWGLYDGTGEEIELTPTAYFDKFVYDVDFLNAEKITVNQSSVSGNTINNILQVYPASVYTESYFSGFKKEYGGLDWRALRLVYEKVGEQYYLIALVHDQWTT